MSDRVDQLEKAVLKVLKRKANNNLVVNKRSRTVIINRSDDRMLPPEDLLRKMFEMGTGDWEMISSDGEAHKFHQSVLSAQVPHFRSIFAHEGTQEWIKKQVLVPPEMEISGPAVAAFLRYVYYQDLDDMESSFGITAALVRAGHYYDIPELVRAANDVIRVAGTETKNLEWFSVEELWKLYQQVWLWEETHPIKKELIETVTGVINLFCGNKTESDKLLAVTGGDPVLRDLMVGLAQCHPPALPPTPLGLHSMSYREACVPKPLRRPFTM